LGVFLVSFLGSLIVFVPAPYFFPIALVSIGTKLDPNIIMLSGALGATIAKTIILRASYFGQKIISEQTRRRIRPFQKLVSRYGWLAAFVAAATPIPDDIIYIPMGFAKYDIKLFFPATFAGKLLITGVVAWGARLLGVEAIGFLLERFADPRVVVATIAGFVAVVILMIYTIIRTDWAKVLSRWFPWTVED